MFGDKFFHLLKARLLGLMSQSPIVCDLALLKAYRGLWYVLRLRLAA
jgi:hypothetical protein